MTPVSVELWIMMFNGLCVANDRKASFKRTQWRSESQRKQYHIVGYILSPNDWQLIPLG